MNIQEKIKVMQEYAENPNVKIQAKPTRDVNSVWGDVDTPHWNWGECEYRVKPAPKRFWLIINPGGLNQMYTYEEEQIARSELNNLNQYRNSQSYMILVEEILS